MGQQIQIVITVLICVVAVLWMLRRLFAKKGGCSCGGRCGGESMCRCKDCKSIR
ncbi:MAG: hypothetical protein WCQ55_06630 [Paludibacteraceae bacterium]